MATTIKVNGQTITIADKAKTAKAVESVISSEDEFDFLAKATESAVLADVMCASMESFAADKSVEGIDLKAIGGAAKDNAKKFAAAAVKVWEKIIDFFKNIGTYVISFIGSKAVKARAALLAKRLENGGHLDFSDAPQFDSISGIKAIRGRLDAAVSSIKHISERGDNASAVDKADMALKSVLDAGNKSAKKASAKEVISLVCGASEGAVKKYLVGIVKGDNDEFKALVENHKAAKESEKGAIANKKNNDKSVIRKYNLLVKAQNAQIRNNIKIVSIALRAMAAVITGPEEK